MELRVSYFVYFFLLVFCFFKNLLRPFILATVECLFGCITFPVLFSEQAVNHLRYSEFDVQSQQHLTYVTIQVVIVLYEDICHFLQTHMQSFTTYIVEMMKKERLFASQGGPIILAQVKLTVFLT